jgi:hypothetical protein
MQLTFSNGSSKSHACHPGRVSSRRVGARTGAARRVAPWSGARSAVSAK